MNNSDILFIYDAKMCNPNGDPDDENKPRMDYETGTNLVSDVRLKRYIRNYLEGRGELIFVTEVDGRTVDATQRLAYWISEELRKEGKTDKADEIKEKVEKGAIKDKDFSDFIREENLLNAFIDVRMFGATMPIKGGEKRGQSFTFTGPIQFNWGYSLNKVSLVESSTISSTFAGVTTEGQAEFGTFGKDYRVYYSLIAFHGIISGKRAEHTELTEKDVELIDEALIKSIPLQATRSKIGQYPRLLLRVEYNDNNTFLGDLRRHIKLKTGDIKEEKLRDISQFELDVDELVEILNTNNEKIKRIRIWQDNELKPELYSVFGDKIEKIDL
ncbi:type I-B CRISPR-associated protein Cas7/Csh2 [candidate division KSB1 bacterium]|nr:MAG: type I-B CRISPR-associated protein Cas7/Csh2 [candidate division KSB1 bacterium]